MSRDLLLLKGNGIVFKTKPRFITKIKKPKEGDIGKDKDFIYKYTNGKWVPISGRTVETKRR